MTHSKVDLAKIHLNWKEIGHYVLMFKDKLIGRYLDRIFIPSREAYSSRFLKNEFCLRFSGSTSPSLLIRLQPNQAYFAYFDGKPLKSEKDSSKSPFLLQVTKILKGARLEALGPLPKERGFFLKFSYDRLLVFMMFPSHPIAYYLESQGKLSGSLPFLYSSKEEGGGNFMVPDGSRSPENVDIRALKFKTVAIHFDEIQAFHLKHAFQKRAQRLQKILKIQIQKAKKRLRSNQVMLKNSTAEPDWALYGEILKSHLYQLDFDVSLKKSHLLLENYEDKRKVTIPLEKKYTLNMQVEKFFQKEKRKKRKISESKARIEDHRKELKEALFHIGREFNNLQELQEFEKKLGLGHRDIDQRLLKKWPKVPGKKFLSSDGLMIFIGRNYKENQTLTFKLAKGNDLWMHVKGRPGAHLVIHIPKNKSVPLETLIDAAHLVIYFSGGKEWGKTEVDYTFRKYVKKIKNSTEVSYIQNKTLVIQLDEKRMNRLLGK